ncbi:hypothetical protein [Shinella zoogloeoides]|uniref:hypothetical protein n=1 Tax=Shinella zoogloeoides TaxID=352475 RepID=UPI0027401685|nr:hypothetical protein [Shinella zoogloeoides]WLR92180.1 hypothetical protein Q9316_17190 [Shinella zoogloeoides]
MSSAISGAKAHFAGQGMLSHDVPEWGQPGHPLKIHYRPLTVAQRRKIWRDDGGASVDGNVAVVRAVLFSALDAKGVRLFDDMDEHALMYEVDSDVVSRVGALILGFSKGAPVSGAKQVDDAKNA